MRSSLSFIVESFLLFEASLLQYAHFAAAATNTSSSNLSSSILGPTCTGCTISAPQTILSYSHSVKEITTSSSVTIIPYITVYDDGKNITNYSTYTKYSSGASDQGLHTNAPPVTWETLGTTLTYPTTYIAYPSIFAGADTPAVTACQTSLARISISPSDQSHLIFPLGNGADAAQITASAQAILDALPTIISLVEPYNPSSCSHGLGLSLEATSTALPGTFSPAPVSPVTHTSVRFLTSQGQAVIIKKTGIAAPTTEPTSPPTTTTTTPPVTQKPNSTPVLVIGGSTITAGPDGGFAIGGATLSPGGSAQVVGGLTVSVASGGSVAVVNGQTSTLVVGASSSGTAGSSPNVQSGQGSAVTVRLWISGFAVGLVGVGMGLCM